MIDRYHTKTSNCHAAGSFPVTRGVIHFDQCNVLDQFAIHALEPPDGSELRCSIHARY